MLLTAVGWIYWITFCLSSNYCSVLHCKATNEASLPCWSHFTRLVITIWHHKKITMAKPEATLDKLIIFNETGDFECSRSSRFVTATAHKDPSPTQATVIFIYSVYLWEKDFLLSHFSLSFIKDHLKTKKAKIFERNLCQSPFNELCRLLCGKIISIIQKSSFSKFSALLNEVMVQLPR